MNSICRGGSPNPSSEGTQGTPFERRTSRGSSEPLEAFLSGNPHSRVCTGEGASSGEPPAPHL